MALFVNVNSRVVISAEFGEVKTLFGKARKREVLELIGERAREGKRTAFHTLVDELLISPDAACSHLRRLWRERLVKSADYPSSYRRAALFSPSIRELEFRITRRGKARLDRWNWLDKQREWLP